MPDEPKPGTEEKVAALERRYGNGEALHNPDDEVLGSRDLS